MPNSTLVELGLRAAQQNHDLPHVSVNAAGDPIIAGNEQARKHTLRRTVKVLAPNTAAGTDYSFEAAEVPADLYPNGAKLIAIEFRSSAAITESATLTDTFTFVNRDVNGVNNLTAATMTTNTTANGGIGTTVAHKKYAATLSGTAANLVIPAGGVLVCDLTHASTGTAVPIGCSFVVELEAL